MRSALAVKVALNNTKVEPTMMTSFRIFSCSSFRISGVTEVVRFGLTAAKGQSGSGRDRTLPLGLECAWKRRPCCCEWLGCRLSDGFPYCIALFRRKKNFSDVNACVAKACPIHIDASPAYANALLLNFCQRSDGPFVPIAALCYAADAIISRVFEHHQGINQSTSQI